jgi:hypothetical protein
MKRNIILAVSVVMLSFTLSCNSSAPKVDSPITKPVELASFYYTCPMHPEIHSDKTGKCPICGMDLVKEEIAAPDSLITK